MYLPAPTILSIKVREPKIRHHNIYFASILENLVDLSDNDFLNKARKAGLKVGVEIFAWIQFKENWHEKIREKHGGQALLDENTGKIGVVTDPREFILRYYNLQDVKEISKFKLPSIDSLDEAYKENRILLPWISNKMSTRVANALIQLGIVFSVFYFWIYCKEATTSLYYPAKGTLFSVINQDKITQRTFSILIAIPFISSAILSFYFLNQPWQLFSTVLAGAITFDIYRHVLTKKTL